MRDKTQYTASYDPCSTRPIPMLAQSSQLEEFSNFVPMQQLSFHNPQYLPAPSQGGNLEFNLPQSHQSCHWELEMLESRHGTLESEIGMLKSEIGILKSETGTLNSEIETLKSEIGTLKSKMGMLKPVLNEGDSKSSR